MYFSWLSQTQLTVGSPFLFFGGSWFRSLAFHNLEHMNQVMLCVIKLLGRIVTPDKDGVGDKTLHDHTYGFSVDPLTRFAVVFSALIQHFDHPGVINMQLVKEGSRLTTPYKNKSITEQNSVDISWDLLMESYT